MADHLWVCNAAAQRCQKYKVKHGGQTTNLFSLLFCFGKIPEMEYLLRFAHCTMPVVPYVCRPPFFFAFIFWYISVSVFFANILCSFRSFSLCRATICLYAFYIIQFVFGFLLLCADGVSRAFKCSEWCTWLQYDHLWALNVCLLSWYVFGSSQLTVHVSFRLPFFVASLYLAMSPHEWLVLHFLWSEFYLYLPKHVVVLFLLPI